MSIEFENRLRKNLKHIGRWARRQGIQAYRLYDRDIPAFPLCIELYKEHVHVSEYKTPHTLTDTEHAEWLADCLQVICEVTAVQADKVFLKLRERQKGLSQYERFSSNSYAFWLQESGLWFWVNMTDYLDTGLFLDHRITRSMFKEEAKDKKVLNLFAYTGSFSVYAASGGAQSVDTVDMSQTYLNWAKKNMEQNGFIDMRRYRFHRADVFQWLPDIPSGTFDLIMLDPPTFSNSKKMRDILDVQRDHVQLVNACIRILKPGGKLFFSTNFRKFQLDKDALKAKHIKDISLTTIPNDFRNKQIHYCFLIS